jgi:hypothetical protein
MAQKDNRWKDHEIRCLRDRTTEFWSLAPDSDLLLVFWELSRIRRRRGVSWFTGVLYRVPWSWPFWPHCRGSPTTIQLLQATTTHSRLPLSCWLPFRSITDYLTHRNTLIYLYLDLQSEYHHLSLRLFFDPSCATDKRKEQIEFQYSRQE